MDKYLVKVHVIGKMNQDGECEEVETLSDGLIRRDDTVTELSYREISENEEQSVKVKIIFTHRPGFAETECRILRNGFINSEMLLIKDTDTECIYSSPIGNIAFNVFTESIEYEENREELKALLRYSIHNAGMHLSDAEVKIVAKAKAC